MDSSRGPVRKALYLGAGCPRWLELSDRELISRFQERASQFEELAEMLRADGLVVVTNEYYVFPKPDLRPQRTAGASFPLQRWNEYRVHLEDLGITEGIRRPIGDDKELGTKVFFGLFSWGTVFAGYEKGLVQCESPPSPILPALDDWPGRVNTSAYRHLTGGWYLYVARSG